MDRVQSLIDTEEASNIDQGTSGQSSTLNHGGRPQNCDVELHVEDLATADDLVHTLNPFYIADKELFKHAQDPTVSFAECY